ncbi:sensor histidine kinase [Sunxiuqinia sp. A32]|uniref:sensor histidine kinase n=1 Tax=Sunxiuqinia sp. A32 TaxID=3461496 RepID=UPI0040467593
MKTYSPKRLAIYLAQLLTILSVAFIIFFLWIDTTFYFYLILIAVYFGLVFFIMNFVLNKYVNDKIDPLYKIIRQIPVKEKKKKSKPTKQKNIIADTSFDVEEWAKNQTQEIARLKDMERYRKEFVGNVSHELKTPIFNIQGYILTLLEGGIDDPKINKLYLKRTEKSIDRMISIVEDLESINKLESGEMKLNFEEIDLTKMVEEVIDMEMLMANERKIRLQFDKPEKLVKVKADKKRIMEVLTNLVANGIKYGQRKGYVKISFYDLHDNIMVEVTDNGIGIEKENLPRIFERFYRVDKSRSREQGGTGLGLSIVKHIIEAHEQTINVKSVVDEGTTFTFTLEKAK